MKITSFDNQQNKIQKDPNQDGLFNLFQKNVMITNNLILNLYIVPREFEMRLDRISNHIYGTPNYVEELMIINDIINPYSVKEGQYIYFCPVEYLTKLYTKDGMLTENESKKASLINSSQPNRYKENTSNDNNLPTTIKPSNLKQVNVTKDNKIQIINTFQ